MSGQASNAQSFFSIQGQLDSTILIALVLDKHSFISKLIEKLRLQISKFILGSLGPWFRKDSSDGKRN